MPERISTDSVRIAPWSEHDLELLRRTNSPEMTEHLGGPETDDKILARHQRYLDLGPPGSGQMFRIALLNECQPAGSVGYWERVWQDETVYEIGWMVLPAFQGRGIAAIAAAAAIDHARAQRKHRSLHAFPSVENPASNTICRKLGFVLIGPCDFEYPPGSIMRCNDWRLTLDETI
jgi:RimJ/RimL family protein N-acetyltransferase